jgi:hypothetical protein
MQMRTSLNYVATFAAACALGTGLADIGLTPSSMKAHGACNLNAAACYKVVTNCKNHVAGACFQGNMGNQKYGTIYSRYQCFKGCAKCNCALNNAVFNNLCGTGGIYSTANCAPGTQIGNFVTFSEALCAGSNPC